MLEGKALPRPFLPASLQDRLATGALAAFLLMGGAIYLLSLSEWDSWALPAANGEALILFGAGLVYLGSGAWTLLRQRHSPTGRAFTLFAASSAIALAGFIAPFGGTPRGILSGLPLALAGGALIHLTLVFPQEARILDRLPFLAWVSYLPAGYLALSIFISLPGSGVIHETPLLLELFTAGALLLFTARTTWQRYTLHSPIGRAQARLALWGTAAAFLPLGTWWLLHNLKPEIPYSPALLIPLGAFPLSLAFGLLRSPSIPTDRFISQGLLHALLSLLVGAGYALLVTGLSLLSSSPFSAASPFLIGVLVAGLALALLPLREQLQKPIDLLFFQGRGAYQDSLRQFRNELTHLVERDSVIQLTRQTIQQDLAPRQVHIYVLDPLSDQYIATPDESGRPTSDLRFSADSALAQNLGRRTSPFFIERGLTIPRALQPDWARMALLGAQLFVPLPGREKLIGWAALGRRSNGDPYTEQDLVYLGALGKQIALALERAQVVSDLERRIHQLNILARVAQGINVTLAFDDILELIYAQTSLAIPLDEFHILLADRTTGALVYAFYLEKDERLTHQENNPLPERQGLAQEVLRSGRALITNDYDRECQNRAILPVSQGVLAWMGVPLNTGAETFGTLSLASRDPAVTYTTEQRDFFQAIADQAAGAIAKARLLQEAEQRARQLASLHEVARSMASTLDLGPLLERILDNAVDILNCEAGSLFLVDEATGDLEFKVTTGPVASELTGQRLPSGTGVVGKVVDSGQPIIVNNVQHHQNWFDATDQQTGFITRSLLAVPLRAKDRTIGVIEVINKLDGSHFGQDDQELLTIFAGQSTVAMENARLYMLTDQALAARVAELSVMQRIDRELNTSLDMRHAMQITLDWAIKQSASDAGFVGEMSGEDLTIVAFQGYPAEVETGSDPIRLQRLPAIQEALANGNPASVHSPPGGSDARLLETANSQIAAPIRREGEVIGVIFLESGAVDHYQEEIQRFLHRLSDHAAIAISNAQLYAEVQAANLAKSDFVSFVSHELKTPMTSIKGYADLLAKGAVGPVNEAQENFLSTIRSNVNRMATLVSDLADISRIEAGRMRLEFSAVPVQEIVDEVVRSTRQQIEEKEQTLQVGLLSELPMVWGDRTRLIQILTNLLSNANKYTPKGGEIQMRAEHSANTWDPKGAPQVIHISVQDNGIGIREEDQGKIFQKFFRSEDPKAREAPGTGLGLNITRSLVEMQEGCIWFESQYGVGTTFHFTIPTVEPN